MEITRNMKCDVCGFVGKIEAEDTINSVPESEIFKSLGLDSGPYLHFKCPSCNADLSVHSLKFMGAKQVVGYSTADRLIEDLEVTSAQMSAPLPTIVWGVVCLVIAIFLVFKFGRGTYILSGILVYLAYSFFASLWRKGPIDRAHKDAIEGLKFLNKK